MATMMVTLSHSPNPDIDGGYWTSPMVDGRPRSVNVKSFADASRVVRSYIESNGLGGGNWTGGDVFDMDGRQLATVSYNGRVWSMYGTEIING